MLNFLTFNICFESDEHALSMGLIVSGVVCTNMKQNLLINYCRKDILLSLECTYIVDALSLNNDEFDNQLKLDMKDIADNDTREIFHSTFRCI